MKAKTLAALKTKFTGVQDAILGRVADKLIANGKVAKEADVATAVAGVEFQQVLEMYGDSRAGEASITAVRNYETAHKLKDGKPLQEGVAKHTADPAANAAGGGEEPEKAPAWAEKLIAANKALTDRLNALEKGRTAESRRSRLEAVIGTLPEHLRKAYARTPLEAQTDDEFTALLADVTNEVAEIEKQSRAAGAVTGRPLG